MTLRGASPPVALLACLAACSGASIAACSGTSTAVDAGRSTDVPAAVDVPVAVDVVDVVDVTEKAPDVSALDAPTDDTPVDDDVPVSDVPTDAPVSVALAVPCADTAANVYVTPAGLPLFSPAERGAVVRCTVDPPQSLAMVESSLRAANVEGVTAAWPVDVYRIAFRTMRNTIGDGLSSARVYVPRGVVGPRPLVVVAHPSEGIADTCATSRRADSMRDLALPWAARGYPVIAPDYAGLGTDGTQGYLDNRDTAQSLLDGARALRRMLTPGSLSSRILLVGHSQGGGAVLAAQSLVRTYGADGDIAAAVVFAPEWPSRINSFRLLDALRNPDALTITYGLTTPVVATSMAFAFYENYLGAGRGGEAFPALARTTSPASINSLCLTGYGGYVQGLQLRVRDWLDEPVRAGFVACATDRASPACAGPGRVFFEYVRANAELGQADPMGAPVLYVQGMLDTIMPPAREAACNLLLLRRAGVDVEVCTDNAALHTTVVERNARRAIAWAEARLAGGTIPGCTGPAMPDCEP